MTVSCTYECIFNWINVSIIILYLVKLKVFCVGEKYKMFQDLETHVYVVLTEKDCVCEFKYLAVIGFFFLWP